MYLEHQIIKHFDRLHQEIKIKEYFIYTPLLRPQFCLRFMKMCILLDKSTIE